MARYHISNSGNDSNIGSEEFPFSTWSKAISVAISGDEISFKRGDTFNFPITLSKPNITISSYGTGDDPIINGLKTITNWVNVGGGIWESTDSSYPSYLSQILFDGTFKEKGRWPKSNASNGGYAVINGTTGKGNLTSSQLSGQPNFVGAEVWVRDMNWSLSRSTVSGHSGNTLTFNAGDIAYNFGVNHGFFIQNIKSVLTELGEWSYNTSTKTISMYFGSNTPSSYTIQASVIDRLVSCTSGSVTNVDIDGLELLGANQNGVYLASAGQIDVLNCTIKFSGQSGVYSQFTKNTKVDNCKIYDSLWNGIEFRNETQNSIITNNRIYRSGLVAGHHFSGNGGGYGIAADWANSLIEWNHVFDSGYIGIRFGQNDSKVRHNWIDNFCLLKDDGAGIYSFRGGGRFIDKNLFRQTGKSVFSNIVTNGKGNAYGVPTSNEYAEGIYFDDNESGIECSYNFIARTTRRGLFPHNNYEISIHNNIVFNCLFALELLENVTGSSMRDMEVYNNTLITSLPRLLLKYFAQYNDLELFGSSDNNKLINISSQTKLIQAYNNNVFQGDYTLAEWKSSSWPYDKNTTQYTPAVVSGDNVFYDINPSKESKTVTLGGTFVDHNGVSHDTSGTWVDQDGNLIGSSFTIEPYRGKVLFKVSNADPEPEPDTPPVVNIYYPESESRLIYGKSVTINTGVTSSNSISKVEFFVNNSIVGTVNEAPWNFTFIPESGNLTIHSVATDSEDLIGTSETIDLEVINFGSNVKINAGTNQDVFYNGDLYLGDRNFLELYSESLEDDVSPVTTEEIFLTGRAAPVLEYNIPIPNGDYTVKLFFNEPWFGVHVPGGAGKRVFDINIEGVLVKEDFDIFIENNNQNTILTFDDINVSDGNLQILLNNSNNKANISGIEILPYSSVTTKNVEVTSSGGGTVSGGGTYNIGDTAIVSATANEGYEFDKWSNNITDNPYSFEVVDDVYLTAIFKHPEIPQHNIDVTQTSGGIVTGGGTYNEGDQVELQAIPNTNYKFVKWSNNTTTNPYIFEAATGLTISAIFKEIPTGERYFKVQGIFKIKEE